MKSLLFVFIVLSMTCFAQLDTLDRVDLKSNQTYTGKVIKVTSNTVQFRESVTNLLHEFNKSEIRDMKLSNGVTVTFDNTAPIGQQQNVTGSSRTETQPPQNTQTQNPPSQSQAAGSGGTQAGTKTGQSENKTQTGSKSQTENRGQQSQNTQNAAAPGDGSGSGMDTSKVIMLAAGGLVVLLLIGALIF